ncbi:MAG: hypothetical protein AB7I18_03740 [Candidatus Berkiella sp.]
MNTLVNHGVKELSEALTLNDTELATLIIHHPDFSADYVGFRAYLWNQLDVLAFLQASTLPMPLTNTFLNVKMLAHRFSIDGYITMYSDNTPIPFMLGGHIAKIAMNEAYLSLDVYAQLHPQSQLEDVVDALAFSCAPDFNGQNAMIYLRQENPLPLYIPSGWEGHIIGLVIHNDTLYICNRGEGSDSEHAIVVYHIGNQEALNAELIDRLILREESRNFIQKELHELLELTEINSIAGPVQTVGNCAWFSAIESIHAMLIAKDPMTADIFFKDWVAFDLNLSLSSLPLLEDPRAQAMQDEVLSKILLSQHNAFDLHHVERGHYILEHVLDPSSLLKSLADPLFHQALINNQSEIPNQDRLHLLDILDPPQPLNITTIPTFNEQQLLCLAQIPCQAEWI